MVAADDGQVANVGLIHFVHRGLVILVRVCNDELRSHHFLQPRTSGFELPVHHSTHDVALGEDPAEPLAVEDRDDPDIVGGHHPAGIGDGRVPLQREEEPVTHDVAERLHSAPPRIRWPPHSARPIVPLKRAVTSGGTEGVVIGAHQLGAHSLCDVTSHWPGSLIRPIWETPFFGQLTITSLRSGGWHRKCSKTTVLAVCGLGPTPIEASRAIAML